MSTTVHCRFGPLLIEYDARVLQPRPWTLEQSNWAAELAAAVGPGPILELCAGAGHIGLAAAVLADRDLVQVEADEVAAGYARANAARAGRAERTDVRVAPMARALHPTERFPLVIADPPYLPSAQVPEWPDDPVAAIDGGADGLALISQCLAVAAAHLTPDGRLLLQVAGPGQADAVAGRLPGFGLAGVRVRVVDDRRAIVLIERARSAAGRHLQPPAQDGGHAARRGEHPALPGR